MKKLSFSMLAMAGLLLASCADKDVIGEGGGQQNEMLPEGYMALNINLPTTPITRAINDDFDDGTANEYKVADCALLLFEGAADGTENDAKLFSAQKINLDTEVNADNDNVTSSHLAVATVKGRETVNGKIYALALLNYTKVVSFTTDGFLEFKNINSGDDNIGKGKTLADIRELITTLSVADLIGGEDKDYFFMTNAVLSKAQGGVVTTAPTKESVFQLAELDPTKIYDTADKAKKSPAGEIFVERAVAKATLSYNKDLTVNGLPIEKVEWVIDNMEPNTYVFRNPGDLSYIGYINKQSNNYRFVGNVSTNGATPSASTINYRTYWCIDPQYDDDATGMLPVYDSATGLAAPEPTWVAAATTADEIVPLYCHENTFDVDHQNYKNTTRAIIRVTLKKEDGTGKYPTFWTVNGGNSRYTKIEDVEGDVATFIIENAAVEKCFKDYLKDGETWKITKADFDITWADNTTKAGILKIVSVDLADGIKNSDKFKPGFAAAFKALFIDDTPDERKATDLLEALNNNIVVREYQEGVLYYEARFQHFAGIGDADLAPWNSAEYEEGHAPVGGSTATAYPAGENRDRNYLGRYGMVRNNWYDVVVTSFNSFGYPKDPSGQVTNEEFDDPDTPDDNLKEHISVKIHVLSWAKRLQSWGF